MGYWHPIFNTSVENAVAEVLKTGGSEVRLSASPGAQHRWTKICLDDFRATLSDENLSRRISCNVVGRKSISTNFVRRCRTKICLDEFCATLSDENLSRRVLRDIVGRKSVSTSLVRRCRTKICLDEFR